MSLDIVGINGPRIPQSHELVELSFSHCEILDQAEVSIVVSLEHFKFNIQLVGVILDKKTCKSVWTVSKV